MYRCFRYFLVYGFQGVPVIETRSPCFSRSKDGSKDGSKEAEELLGDDGTESGPSRRGTARFGDSDSRRSRSTAKKSVVDGTGRRTTVDFGGAVDFVDEFSSAAVSDVEEEDEEEQEESQELSEGAKAAAEQVRSCFSEVCLMVCF